MIEEVEELCPQLQVNVLIQPRVLHQRRINILVSRSIENVSSRVAKSPGSWKNKG